MLRRGQRGCLDPNAISQQGTDAYEIDAANGSVTFSVGSLIADAHVRCRAHGAQTLLSSLDRGVGHRLTVSGYLRCSPWRADLDGDDPRIFELHVVEVVGRAVPFVVDLAAAPEPAASMTAADLQAAVRRMRVNYEPASDSLTFEGKDGRMPDFLRLSGEVTDIWADDRAGGITTFHIGNGSVDSRFSALCAGSWRGLGSRSDASLTIVALPSLDLRSALRGVVAIRLLTVAFEPDGSQVH